MMKTLVGVDPGAASCLPPFAGLHRITRKDQFILRTKSRDQPVGNTRERLEEKVDSLPDHKRITPQRIEAHAR
jgi:hypothetical protein